MYGVIMGNVCTARCIDCGTYGLCDVLIHGIITRAPISPSHLVFDGEETATLPISLVLITLKVPL